MVVDYFGRPIERKRKTEFKEGLSNKEIEDLLTAHKFLNIVALKKIDKLDLRKLDGLSEINVEKLVSLSKNTVDVKTYLENFKKDFKEKRKDRIQEIIFDEKNNFENFRENFQKYLITNTFLRDYFSYSFE